MNVIRKDCFLFNVVLKEDIPCIPDDLGHEPIEGIALPSQVHCGEMAEWRNEIIRRRTPLEISTNISTTHDVRIIIIYQQDECERVCDGVSCIIFIRDSLHEGRTLTDHLGTITTECIITPFMYTPASV